MDELLGKAIPAREKGRDKRTMDNQAEQWKAWTVGREALESLQYRKGGTGKPGLWKGRHWQLPQNRPVLQQELLSHICRRLWLWQAAKSQYFAFAKEFAVRCKSLTLFILLLDVSILKKSSGEKVIISAKYINKVLENKANVYIPYLHTYSWKAKTTDYHSSLRPCYFPVCHFSVMLQ